MREGAVKTVLRLAEIDASAHPTVQPSEQAHLIVLRKDAQAIAK